MKKQNGFIKILLVVIVLILIVGVYFIYSKKGDDITSLPSVNHNNSSSASSPYPMKELTREEDLSIGMVDWKIYRNERYEFEVRYPSNFIINRQTIDSMYLANSQLCAEKLKVSSPGYVESGCLFFSIIIQDNKIIHEGLGVTHETIKISGLNGEKIIDQSNKAGDEYSNITVQFKKENKWYIFDIINNKNDNKNAGDLLDQVLPTFKFTK